MNLLQAAQRAHRARKAWPGMAAVATAEPGAWARTDNPLSSLSPSSAFPSDDTPFFWQERNKRLKLAAVMAEASCTGFDWWAYGRALLLLLPYSLVDRSIQRREGALPGDDVALRCDAMRCDCRWCALIRRRSSPAPPPQHCIKRERAETTTTTTTGVTWNANWQHNVHAKDTWMMPGGLGSEGSGALGFVYLWCSASVDSAGVRIIPFMCHVCMPLVILLLLLFMMPLDERETWMSYDSIIHLPHWMKGLMDVWMGWLAARINIQKVLGFRV